MSDEITNRGGKGLKLMWGLITILLIISLFIYVYQSNQNALPG